MTTLRLGKIILLSFVLALCGHYAMSVVDSIRQRVLTKEICGLVSLPLETGLLRDTFDGIESALKARGEVNACVSVTDNGRSFSPDCTNPDVSYRTVMCKAEGNTGVRAAISFENPGPFNLSLIYLWFGIALAIAACILVFNFLARSIIEVYTSEVSKLLLVRDEVVADSLLSRLARFTMVKVGIARKLTEKATVFREQFREYEQRIEAEAASRSKLEQGALSSEQYFEKVKQIRHDIRSPLSSLQSIYEKLSVTEGLTTKALATAIRRIQLLVEDLDQMDKFEELAKLVIAEIAVEEMTLVMSEKYRDVKSATLSLHYGQESLSPICVGPKSFQSAVENVLENALDAISVGGSVNVHIRSHAGFCEIRIEDDGCGISAENLVRLFAHGGSFGKVNGQGLGLYNTKKSITTWGGTIKCESLPQGTRFVIAIPLMQTGVVFTTLPKNPRIKIIDDDPQIPGILTQAGFEVLDYASNFSDGQKLLADGTSDDFSILVDMRLGQNNLGTELIAQQSGRKRVFLCTNDFDDLTVIKLAREIGVKIVPKPLCYYGQHRVLLQGNSIR